MKIFEESDRLNYPHLTTDDVVLDGGMFEGNWANQIHAKYGCKVIGFEPVPEFFAECAKRFDRHPAIRVFNLALSDRKGVAKLGVKGALSGLYCSDPNERAEAKMTTLRAFMDEQKIEFAALTKLNVEGSEIPILEHAIAGEYVWRLGDLQIQPHACIPDAVARWEEIKERLAATHDMTFDSDWCWSGWRLKP